jgi:hypothetical protein
MIAKRNHCDPAPPDAACEALQASACRLPLNMDSAD